MMKSRTLAGLAALLLTLAGAGSASAQDASARSRFDTSPSVGIALGNPIGVVARVPVLGRVLAVGLGAGSGTVAGTGFAGHADILMTPLVLGQDAIPLHIGVGLRFYSHRYDPASVDEIPDRHIGVRFPVGLGFRLRGMSIETFAEVAPGWDVSKTSSCSFFSGTRSLCPHDDDRFFVHFALGARYVF